MILGRAQGAGRRRPFSASPRSPTGSTATSPAGASRSRALGQFIDPFADKLLTIAAFISLVQMDLAPAWMVAIIIGREFAVTALRSAGARPRRVDAGLAARQDQDGGAGGRDPRADPRQGSPARVLHHRPGGAVGGGDHRAGLGRRLLPPLRSAAADADCAARSSADRTVGRRLDRGRRAGALGSGRRSSASIRFLASSRYSLCSNSVDQLLVVGQRLGLAARLEQRLRRDRNRRRRGR